MAKRYYLCDIIGDGDIDGGAGAFRPSVADLGVAWVGSIPTGEDGRPLNTWALVLVATPDHSPLRSRQGIDALPDFPLDGRVSGINAAVLATMKAAMTRRGLPSSIVDGKDGYRDVLRAIGKSVDAGFDENNFDVAE